jgi:hypothetical protein
LDAAAVKREWKTVEGFEDYEVSNLGEVWSHLTSKLLRPGLTTAGYLTVALRRGGKSRTRYVHDLVARAFIPNPERKRTVNHQRRPTTNNRVSNLEWMTYGENHAHAYRYLGRVKAGKPVANSLGQRYDSSAKAARFWGVTPSAVATAARNGTVCCNLFWWFD